MREDLVIIGLGGSIVNHVLKKGATEMEQIYDPFPYGPKYPGMDFDQDLKELWSKASQAYPNA